MSVISMSLRVELSWQYLWDNSTLSNRYLLQANNMRIEILIPSMIRIHFSWTFAATVDLQANFRYREKCGSRNDSHFAFQHIFFSLAFAASRWFRFNQQFCDFLPTPWHWLSRERTNTSFMSSCLSTSSTDSRKWQANEPWSQIDQSHWSHAFCIFKSWGRPTRAQRSTNSKLAHRRILQSSLYLQHFHIFVFWA